MCAEYVTSSWRLTEMLHTLRQFTAQCNPTYITLCYVNDTMTRPTSSAAMWATCDRMLQTPQCHFAAQCSTNCITLHYINDTTHGRKHTRLGCHASSWSGFLIFCPSMLCVVFLFFRCCLSVQKLVCSFRDINLFGIFISFEPPKNVLVIVCGVVNKVTRSIQLNY